MKETTVHRAVAQYSGGSCIGIGKDGFRPEFTADLLESLSYLVVSLLPTDAVENLEHVLRSANSASFRSDAAHGIEHAVG